MNSMKNSRCFGILMRKKNIWKTWPTGIYFKKYSIFGFCHFESGKPQNLNYKIDWITKLITGYLKTKRNLIIILHCLKMQDGNMFMAPKQWKPIFFADEWEGRTDIFSDRVSAAARYKTLYRICLANIACFIFYLCIIYFRRRRSFKTGIFDSGLVGTYRKGILVRILFWTPFCFASHDTACFLHDSYCFLWLLGSKAKKNYEAVMNEDTDKEWYVKCQRLQLTVLITVLNWCCRLFE